MVLSDGLEPSSLVGSPGIEPGSHALQARAEMTTLAHFPLVVGRYPHEKYRLASTPTGEHIPSSAEMKRVPVPIMCSPVNAVTGTVFSGLPSS